MEPDYNNNYHNSYQSEFKPNGFDDLHLDDEVYEIKSDRINPEDFYQEVLKEAKESEEQIVILCDIKGGSVHTALSKLAVLDNVMVFSGMNMGLALDVVMKSLGQNLELADANDLIEAAKEGMTVMNGENAEVRVGICLPLANIPVGTQIHNIELLPGKGGQLVRSAGLSAQLMAKEGKYATLRLPSGEMRMVPIQCRATIGVIGNGDHNLVNIGKAGRKRHMGIRPTVRGSVMNPNDHPHGGGEGKAPVGRPGPCTPWGKPALGLKTRKKNKQSNKMIVRRRDGRAIK